jgi:glutathione peroxidase
MFKNITTLILFFAALQSASAFANSKTSCSSLLDHTVKVLAEERQENLCDKYNNKVVLVVNTASRCVYTPQYTGLEDLYDKYRDRGLVVLGFPSNDFGAQEPGTEKVIKDFCELTYNVKFPMFEKTGVTEYSADPLYRELAKAAGGEYPRWNFHKYLLDRNGKFIASFQSSVRPDDPALIKVIESLL